MQKRLRKHLVTVAVSGWEDRGVIAGDTNEAMELALHGDYTVTRAELVVGRVIGTEILGHAPEASRPGAWPRTPPRWTVGPGDEAVQRRRAELLKEAFFSITDAGGLGDTLAIGPSPNDDGTINVFLVSSLGEASPCEVTLAPDDLDNLAKAARAALALDAVEEAMEGARRELRGGKIPTGPRVVA